MRLKDRSRDGVLCGVRGRAPRPLQKYEREAFSDVSLFLGGDWIGSSGDTNGAAYCFDAFAGYALPEKKYPQPGRSGWDTLGCRRYLPAGRAV